MAADIHTEPPYEENPRRPLGWRTAAALGLPLAVMLGAVIILHLEALPAWQEMLGQAGVVVLGFGLWALAAPANPPES